MPIQPRPTNFYAQSQPTLANTRRVGTSQPVQIEEEFRRIIELNKCKADPVYFISNYLYIFETRKEFEEGFKPFKLWPRQVEYVHFLEQAFNSGWKEITVEKPRDMGVSLLTEAWILTKFLFTRDFSAIMATLTEDLIKLMPGHDTLFAKLRDYLEQLQEHTPWLMPKGFEFSKHLTSMNLSNPENGNTIRGMLGTERFGRSARASVLWRDESAFWDNDTSENTAQTAQLNIDTSSVNGYGFFHEMCEAAASYEPSRNFSFEWWHAENHTQKWFDTELDRATRKGAKALAKFKREVLKDKKAIAEGLIYPLIEHVARGEYEFNPDFQTFTISDYGYSDMGVMGILQRDPDNGDLFLIEEVYNRMVGIEWFVPFFPGAPPVLNVAYHYEPEDLEKQNRIKTYKPNSAVRHYGDKTGNQRTAAQGKSVFDILREYKINVRCGPGWNNMNLRQNSVNSLLPRLHIHNRCEYFHTSFTQFSIPKKQENSQSTKANDKGVHTWSHFPSALEAFAISEPPLDFDKPADPVMKEDRYAVVR